MKQSPKRIGRTDISDLNEDVVVVWQHMHYLHVVLLMGLVVPTLVAGLLWGDWFGGLIYARVRRERLHAPASRGMVLEPLRVSNLALVDDCVKLPHSLRGERDTHSHKGVKIQ